MTITHPYVNRPLDEATDQINMRPPLIICGMKLRNFLLVVLVIALITASAAVGGIVGGQNLRSVQLPSATM